MRKQTKITAVVSAAALLALGASITSFAAAKGTWMMVDGEWYCYDKNGDVYENTFCSSNGKEYYVGDDGMLVRSSWVDGDDGEKYFVNSSGAKIVNDWRLTTPYEDEDADEEWFYFQSTGKRAENKKILYKGSTFYFDAEGKMLTGWVTADGTEVTNEDASIKKNNTFYCDETGARVEGSWVYTTAPATADDVADADEYWYYLKSNGKVAAGKQSNVKGQGFIFGNDEDDDSYGQMLTGWVALDKDDNYVEIDKEGSNDKLSNYADTAVYYCLYDEDKADGHIQKNKWMKAWEPAKAFEEDEDVSKEWYWIQKDGKVFIPAVKEIDGAGYQYDLGDGALERDDELGQFDFAKLKVSSKDYFFNMDGEMLSSFINVVETTDKEEKVIKKGMHYFGSSNDGSMKTGSHSIKDDNGDTFKFYFGTSTNDKGVGVTGNKNNKLYYQGHLVSAQDYKYQVAEVNGNKFIINQNGTIQHSKVVYKEDGDELIDATNATYLTDTKAGLNKYAATGLVYDEDLEVDPTIIMPAKDSFVASDSQISPSNGQ